MPFGRIVLGIDVMDALYDGYGESALGGIRAGKQDPLFTPGNAYLTELSRSSTTSARRVSRCRDPHFRLLIVPGLTSTMRRSLRICACPPTRCRRCLARLRRSSARTWRCAVRSSTWRPARGSSGPTRRTASSRRCGGCRRWRRAIAPFPDRSTRGSGPRSRARGLTQLYTHQAEAIAHALAGRNVVVITPTASGKTLCYNAPVLQRDPAGSVERARCICFRPRRSRRISSPSCTSCARRSSATRRRARSACSPTTATRRRTRGATIRARAHVVLSNPDMLHSGILPHHPRWAKLFENLRYVVIDELHAYRGVFGSHLAQRAAAAAAHLPALRIESDVHLLVGDDRQPARAGRAADRAAVRARRRERRAARREVLRLRQPAGRQPAARHPPLVSGRDAARRVGVPEAQPAADRLRAEPAVDRDPDDVSEGRLRGRAGRAGADSRLSRRLSAACAAARSRRGCARARCAPSSRPTRSSSASTSARSTSRDGRLSGHDCRHVAARRPRRAAARADRRRCWWRQQRAARSVRRAATRRTSSTRRPSTRSSIPTTCTSWSIT